MWEFVERDVNPEVEKYNEPISEFQAEAEKTKEDLFNILDGFESSDEKKDLEQIFKNGFSLRVGDREVNFNISDVKSLPVDDLKEEVKQEYRGKLQKIKEVIDQKFSTLSESYESIKEKLEDEYNRVKSENDKFVMPDVNYEHGKKGLSVIRGDEPDSLIWLQRGIYKVTHYGDYRIEKEMVERTATPAVMEITTKGNTVTKVKIKKWANLRNMHHYHSIDGGAVDCWGDWNYNVEWENATDIMDIGKHAFKILMSINPDSIGNHAPVGLPTTDEIKLACIDKNGDVVGDEQLDVENRLSGENERNSVWTL